MIDDKLLAALVNVSEKSLRALGKETGWRFTNMATSLKGERPVPKKWIGPLLTALGLTADAQPDPARPWLAKADEVNNRDALLLVLRHFFPEGGVAREVHVDQGLSGLIESVWGLRDQSGLTRVCLRLRHNREQEEDDQDRESSFSKADLARIGFECQAAIRVPRERYTRWRNGDLANKEFDEGVLSKQVREPSWKDVVAAAKRRGITPGDAMAALMAL